MAQILNELKSLSHGAQRAIPSLDGLRAISITFVLLAHLTGTLHFPLFMRFEELGYFGVRVFFCVISGYLITSILLAEMARTGTVSLTKFYFRRTIRLFPASYFLIAVVAVLAAAGRLALHKYDLALSLTYLMNYYDGRGWNLGHLWSLAVEEQFYLLWPFTLRSLGTTRAMQLLVGVIAITPLIRLSSPHLGPVLGAGASFPLVADALAAGCLLAGWRDVFYRNPLYRRVLTSRWFLVIPLLTLGLNYLPFTKLHWLVLDTLMNAGIALTTDWAMRNPASSVGRILNYPAVSFFGVLSYSLYLWQQIFLNRTSTSPLCQFPVNLVLALGMAMISYLCVESPLLKLRSRWEKTLFPKPSDARFTVTHPQLS